MALLCATIWCIRVLPYDALAGVLIGGAITAVFSRYYYQQASNDLKAEAEKLRDANDIALRMLQTMSGGGKAEVSRDEQGNPTGVIHRMSVSDAAGTTDSVQHELKRGKPEDPEP